MRFDALTLFGLFAVTAMLLCYAFERKGRQYILGFSIACLLGSIYGLAGRMALRTDRGCLGARCAQTLASIQLRLLVSAGDSFRGARNRPRVLRAKESPRDRLARLLYSGTV